MNKQPESSRNGFMQDGKYKIFRFSIKPTIIRLILWLVVTLLFSKLIFPSFIVPAFFSYVGYIPLVHSIYSICHWLFWGLIVYATISCVHVSSKQIYVFPNKIVYMHGIVFIRKMEIYSNEITECYITKSLWQRCTGIATIQLKVKKPDIATFTTSRGKWFVSLTTNPKFKNVENAQRLFELIAKMVWRSCKTDS